MRWRKLERSQNVEDRRGSKAGAVAGGVGGLGIIGVLIALLFGGGGGGGLGDALSGLGSGSAAPQSQEQPPEYQGLDEVEDFVTAILGSTETVWNKVFADAGQTYQPTTLVLFSGFTDSGCGGANAQVGPHYCPLDKTIYIDRDFYAELERRFGASGGDFAEAYVVAHEVAHHVQNELGIMDSVRTEQQRDPGQANAYSVALELQADCLAGVWANSIFQRGDVLEQGDIEEALNAASSVGDDRIQQATQGQVNPETWTHGSSQQRVDWFTQGYQTGDATRCDTFNS
ncbi:MAG: zinc metallopeptidase [bacterium]|nr:zinc metallopeptidase [bacterium]